MVRFVKALFQRPPAGRRRIVLTPGRLFFLMSQELRQSRPAGRCACSMPLPFAAPGEPGKANWDARPGMMQCPECTVAANEILERFRALYDVHLVEMAPRAPSAPPPGGVERRGLAVDAIRAFG